MMELKAYPVIANGTFYKGVRILDYIENNKLMGIDREAVAATIMDALVYNNIINKNMDSLDLKRFEIKKGSMVNYTYHNNPLVVSIPQEFKAKFRRDAFYITGGLPMSIYLAKPASSTTLFSIHDMNVAISFYFTNPKFVEASYISPTRHVNVSNREFVEANINEFDYVIDVLTKRMIRLDYFKEMYNYKENNSIALYDMNKNMYKKYEKNFQRKVNFKFFIALYNSIKDDNIIPNSNEMFYEIARSKEYFPLEWQKSLKINDEKVFKKKYLR